MSQIRVAWCNEPAKAKWQPRINAVRKVFEQVEWMTVRDGVRPCALGYYDLASYVEVSMAWARLGLHHVAVAAENFDGESYKSWSGKASGLNPNTVRCVVGKQADTLEFLSAWDQGDNHTIGRLLGYPDCCRDFFVNKWLPKRWEDPTLLMVDGDVDVRKGATTVVSQKWYANLLLRQLGIRPVPYIPCSFECRATEHLAVEIRATMARSGFEEEAGWLGEMLGWDIEWSSLHGIAEVRTPLFKLVSGSDYLPVEHKVQLVSGIVPEEASQGLKFPWIVQPVPKAIARRAHPDNGATRYELLEGEKFEFSEHYYQDNGFSSRLGMVRNHDEFIQMLGKLGLKTLSGRVLDLGCGNAALLSALMNKHPNVIPHGVELRREAFDNIPKVLPDYAENFNSGNFFDPGVMGNLPDSEFTFLMIGRLVEVSEDVARRFLEWLLSRESTVVVYGYGNWGRGKETFESIAARFDLQLSPLHGEASLVQGAFLQSVQTGVGV